MTPTPILVQELNGPFADITPGSAHVIGYDPDVVDGNSFHCTGRELLLVSNNTGSIVTVTIKSTPDDAGRLEDITSYEIENDSIAVFTSGLTNAKGWKQSDSTILFNVTGTGCKVAVLRLP